MSDFVWTPTPELVERANLTRLTIRLGGTAYRALPPPSAAEPGRGRRPRRDLHADVPGGRRRLARVCPSGRRAGADLLRLRRACDPRPARGRAGAGRDLGGLVAAAR